VRNSWSPAWGEAGYIRLSMTSSPQCGTDLNPSVRPRHPLTLCSSHSRPATQQDGTGCKGGPPTQRVCGTCGILFDNSYPIV
jgi:cathepsin L